jgi:hypothetical protein
MKLYLTFTGNMQLTLHKISISFIKKSHETIKDPEQVKSVTAVERSNIHYEGCTRKQSNSSSSFLPKDTIPPKEEGVFHYMHAADSLLEFNGCTAHQKIHQLYKTQAFITRFTMACYLSLS